MNFNARYYEQNVGRFNGQDPVAFKIAMASDDELKDLTGMNQQELLENPQVLNSYAYAVNNPVKMIDENGEFAGPFGRDMASGQRVISSFLHRAANYVSNQGGFFNRVSGFVTNAIADTVDNIANIYDPDQKATTRMAGLAFTSLDVAVGGEGKAVKGFDAVVQQSKMLEGFVNSKAINAIKSVFKTSDTIPGGTMGALRNEIMTGFKTQDIFHAKKAQNVINCIRNIFKTQTLNSVEVNRLQGIKNSLESLIKNFE